MIQDVNEGRVLLGPVGHDEELGISSTCPEKLLEIYAVRCHHLICIREWMRVFSVVSAPLSFFLLKLLLLSLTF